MEYKAFKALKLPTTPGVYMFMKGKECLYIGKASSLLDRVKSYFGNDILKTRGLHIANMVSLAATIKYLKTDSALGALILENKLIKKYKPKYNTREKDDKSYNYIVITKELFPRVLIVREKDFVSKLKTKNYKLQTSYGPFPNGGELRLAMKIIRKIFPYRDKCAPAIISYRSVSNKKTGFSDDSAKKNIIGKEIKVGEPCFNRQLGLCPGVCDGNITSKDYKKIIFQIKLFFQGEKSRLLKNLVREMKLCSKELNFEKANEIKKTIFALKHIKDIALIKDISKNTHTDNNMFRIEAYDVAHLNGAARVGVMTVLNNGEIDKNEYRKFKLTSNVIDDIGGLLELLVRRLRHKEWPTPDLIVVDGGVAQKNISEKILRMNDFLIPVVAVVKDEWHKPKKILGHKKTVDNYEKEILLANSEAHRFAISYHRFLMSRSIKVGKIKT